MRKQINRRKHCLGSTRRYHALLRLHDQSFQIAKLVFSWKAPSLTLIMIAMKILVVVATPLKFHMFLRWVPHPSHDSFVLSGGLCVPPQIRCESYQAQVPKRTFPSERPKKTEVLKNQSYGHAGIIMFGATSARYCCCTTAPRSTPTHQTKEDLHRH